MLRTTAGTPQTIAIKLQTTQWLNRIPERKDISCILDLVNFLSCCHGNRTSERNLRDQNVTETVGENCCILGVELGLKQRDCFRLVITLKIPIFPKASPAKSGGGLQWALTTSSHQGAPQGVAWKRPWRFSCLLRPINAQEVDGKSINRKMKPRKLWNNTSEADLSQATLPPQQEKASKILLTNGHLREKWKMV